MGWSVYQNHSKRISVSDNLNYFVSFSKFFNLTTGGAVRFKFNKDEAKCLVVTTNFELCSSGSQNGRSLYLYDKGQFVQKQNSFIKSKNTAMSPSFCVYVS